MDEIPLMGKDWVQDLEVLESGERPHFLEASWNVVPPQIQLTEAVQARQVLHCGNLI